MPISGRLLGASLATALMALPLSATAAHAGYPGTDGRIAFVQNKFIYTMAADGSDPHLLARYASRPRWSPDGQRVAFIRHGDLWVMNAEGRQQTRVTASGGMSAPTWSPDGAWLAGVSVPADGSRNVLFKVKSTAPFGAPEIVTARNVDKRPIAWSPDGRSIAFSGGFFQDTYACVDDGLTCISKVDVATGAIDVLVWTGGSVHSQDDLSSPDWKPDGSGFLFSFSQKARDASGDDNLTHVNVLQPSREYTTNAGVYSPDGSRIAFTKRTGTTNEIYTATADGEDWHRLAVGRDADWQPVR